MEDLKIGPLGPNTFGDASDEGRAAPNVAGTDENISLSDLFQQCALPSLARQISAYTKINGVQGGLFALRNKKVNGKETPDLEMVRRNITCYPSVPIKTSITQEAIQDLYAMFGKDAYEMIATMLRAQANEQENIRIMEFLRAECVDRGTVQRGDNPELDWFFINDKVNQCILEANKKHTRTYEAFVVMPYEYHSPVMAMTEQVGGRNAGQQYSLQTSSVGLTKFYINPEPEDKNFYVGLKDTHVKSRCSITFGDYQCTIQTAVDPETGSPSFFIFDRFAIAANPVHEPDDPMLFKFTVA